MEILFLIIGIVIGILILLPKTKHIVDLNEKTIEQNRLIGEENFNLSKENLKISNTIKAQELKLKDLTTEIVQSENNLNVLNNTISLTQTHAKENAELIKEKVMTEMSDSLSAAAERKSKEYQQAEQEFKDEYAQVMADLTKELIENLEDKTQELAAAEQTLADLANKVKLAVAANIREEEKKNKTSFYTLGISDIDIQEVNKIRSILPYLRNGRPLNKAIWECYYRNAANDLTNRVIGTGTHSGIYCITCLLDNKKYIGQAVNLRDRWLQHIKCGLGIDTTNAKLYTAMLEHGVENFSFEVVEECAAADLNKQEKYWIEFYQTQGWGYNQTGGGSRS